MFRWVGRVWNVEGPVRDDLRGHRKLVLLVSLQCPFLKLPSAVCPTGEDLALCTVPIRAPGVFRHLNAD